jgi:hypothetical protein
MRAASSLEQHEDNEVMGTNDGFIKINTQNTTCNGRKYWLHNVVRFFQPTPPTIAQLVATKHNAVCLHSTMATWLHHQLFNSLYGNGNVI